MKFIEFITSSPLQIFPEITGKFPEILNFRKIYNPNCRQDKAIVFTPPTQTRQDSFYPNVTTLRSGLCCRNSVCRLSVCRLLRWCTLLRRLKLSAIFLHRCVRWPPSDLRAKFYGDSPRGIPPSGALNATGVSKCSDFLPIEGYNKRYKIDVSYSIKDE